VSSIGQSGTRTSAAFSAQLLPYIIKLSYSDHDWMVVLRLAFSCNYMVEILSESSAEQSNAKQRVDACSSSQQLSCTF
jgi:hypothetical protein